MQFKKNNKKRGYTIIETMISVSLFIIIVMAGMGALLNANLLHQKSQNMRSIMDNLSFIMEDMSRNLRTGHDYYCMTSNTFPTPIIPDSGDRCDGVAFLSASGGSQLAYRIGSNSIEKYEGGWLPLLPEEVTVNTTTSGFAVLGAESPSVGNFQQPLVIIRLVGEINIKGVRTPFSLQTTVSQRNLDVDI
jgi:Tfp pilus assembly protein PilW